MVYYIKDTSTVFAKNRYETVQEHLLFKLPPVSLKQVETFLYFSFNTVVKFSN